MRNPEAKSLSIAVHGHEPDQGRYLFHLSKIVFIIYNNVMSTIKEILNKLSNVFNMVTDWLLIVIGIVLVVKSALAIDVQLAKYAVMGCGILLTAFGLWYRHRRKKRYRHQDNW